MKRMIAIFLTMTMAAAVLAGCGNGGGGNGGGGSKSSYGSAVDVLKAVFASYKEEDKFAAYGGSIQNPVSDEPGKLDLTATDELTMSLNLPEDQISAVDDGASLIHMMNGNVFTGAAYRLKDGGALDSFVSAVKAQVMSTQWMCGQPDTLLILDVDGSYVIVAYGEAEIMETFKANALSALEGAKVVSEDPIVME